MKYTYILLFTALLTFNLQSQGNINSNLTGATQSALIDFGNRSQRKAQPLNVQGSHYFIKDFKIAKLEYFGKELNDTGYMRYNAFRDEIEMADTQYQDETDVILLKSADVIPLINGERYEYLPYRLESGNAFIGYLVNIYDGKNDKLYLKRKKTFMEAKIARTSLENSFPPRYVESEELYISSNGDTPVKLKQSKKSIISYFKSNSDKVKKFIKSEKLKVSELSSIIKIFEFAENL
ncbi:MAG: hypothetical protein H8E16_02290 [Flavobacteriales bacterium]|jgi:hypothetical protein|nr:hypothetical protein [Flavobacteriales bacterium]|tara:strand:+ start:1408 stop:2115 length:708 start_codon:yes stop_codon:yes gene_type:complete